MSNQDSPPSISGEAADAIAEVWYEFRCYAESGQSLVNQAHHLQKLADAIGDMSSWHPRYDSERGGILGVYEDDDF